MQSTLQLAKASCLLTAALYATMIVSLYFTVAFSLNLPDSITTTFGVIMWFLWGLAALGSFASLIIMLWKKLIRKINIQGLFFFLLGIILTIPPFIIISILLLMALT